MTGLWNIQSLSPVTIIFCVNIFLNDREEALSQTRKLHSTNKFLQGLCGSPVCVACWTESCSPSSCSVDLEPQQDISVLYRHLKRTNPMSMPWELKQNSGRRWLQGRQNNKTNYTRIHTCTCMCIFEIKSWNCCCPALEWDFHCFVSSSSSKRG